MADNRRFVRFGIAPGSHEALGGHGEKTEKRRLRHAPQHLRREKIFYLDSL